MEAERDADSAPANEEPHNATAAGFVGKTLGNRYRVLRRIGSGGMADVYEVEHVRLASPFAAKVLRQHREGSVRRFLREARLLAQLKSDHIVTVFDVGDPNDEAPFYVMELLSGQDLRRLLAATPVLSIERAVKIISDACLGLGVAHAAGLVHRDLKPDNLFVTHRDSGEEVAKLLDFGVAKANEGTSTEHGALIGTVRYMAPEQVEHAGVVSARADVRGLGAILYECLAGRPPHVADSIERLLFKVLNEPIEPVRTHRANVPEELDDVILCALERDPSKRFPTASAFAEALTPFAGTGLGSATIDTTLRDGAPLARRRRRAPTTLWFGLVGTALAAGVGGFVLGRDTSSNADAAVPEGNRSPNAAAPATPPVLTRPKEIEPIQEIPAGTAEPVVPPTPSSTSPGRTQHRARRQAAPLLQAPSAQADAPAPPKAPIVKIEAKNPYDP
jgi:eukaryotic-like serine/threonine-protein kinase